MSAPIPWVLFSYRIAADTSTLRVRAWRILKRIGALSIQNSVCIVPNTSLAVRKLNQLKELVEAHGGQTTWLDISITSSAQTEGLVEQFNKERAGEYMEVVDACRSFTCESEWEMQIAQLEKSLRKIVARDYFNCHERQLAEFSVSDLNRRYGVSAVATTEK